MIFFCSSFFFRLLHICISILLGTSSAWAQQSPESYAPLSDRPDVRITIVPSSAKNSPSSHKETVAIYRRSYSHNDLSSNKKSPQIIKKGHGSSNLAQEIVIENSSGNESRSSWLSRKLVWPVRLLTLVGVGALMYLQVQVIQKAEQVAAHTGQLEQIGDQISMNTQQIAGGITLFDGVIMKLLNITNLAK